MPKLCWPANKKATLCECLIRANTLHVTFIMPLPCNPSPGTHVIFASDSSGVNTCPSGVCGEVVVLHNVKSDVGVTAQDQTTILKCSKQVTFTLDVGEPDCHYQMQVKGGYIGPCAGQSLLGSYKNPSGYWVINFHPEQNGFMWAFLHPTLDIMAGVAYVPFISAFSSMATLHSRGLTQEVQLVVTVRYIYCLLVVNHALNMFSRLPSLLWQVLSTIRSCSTLGGNVIVTNQAQDEYGYVM